MTEINPIRMEFEPVEPDEFHRRYPQYAHTMNMEWAVRTRRDNGMLADGCFVEIPYGSKGRMKCRVIPALMHKRITGESPIRPSEDRLLDMITEQNRRLAIVEARLGAICTTLEQAFER